MRTQTSLGFSFLLSMVTACDQVEIILEGWPWNPSSELSLSAVHDKDKESQTATIPNIHNGRFRISLPSSGGTLSLVLEMGGKKKCSPKVNITDQGPLKFTQNDLNYRKCDCNNGWCAVQSTDKGENYSTIAGSKLSDLRIFAGGSQPNNIGMVRQFGKTELTTIMTPDGFKTPQSMWIEGKDSDAKGRLWVASSSDIYLKNDTANMLYVSYWHSSYNDTQPMVNKISGPPGGNNRQILGKSQKTDRAMILHPDEKGIWSNSIDDLGREIDNKTLYGAWIQQEDNELWAVGSNGLIVNRHDGRYSPVRPMQDGKDYKVDTVLKSIWCADSINCWAVGDNGNIYSFVAQLSENPPRVKVEIQYSGDPDKVRPLMGIWGADKENIWAVGSEGTIVFYNGGTWVKSKRGDADLNDIWGLDKDCIFIVGNSGTILVGEKCNPSS